MRREAVALAALLVAGRAAALVGEAGDPLQVVASARTVTAVTVNHDSPLMLSPDGTVHSSDGLGAALLRLQVVARPGAGLSGDLHLVEAVSFSTAGAAGALIAPPPARYRLLGAGVAQAHGPSTTADLLVDRAAVTWRGAGASLTLGRQPITFGKAHFWNALDLFSPFAATAFDRDYKPGVDAARLDVALGEASGLTAVAATGRSDGVAPPGASWRGSAALLHAYTTLAGVDLSAQGGKVQGGWHAGAAAAGTVGPLDLRAEAAAFFPARGDALPRSVTAVAGAGHRFDSGLVLEGELLFQGAARTGSLAERLALEQQGRLLQASPLVIGALAERDLTPLLHGSLGLLCSANDGSLAILPGLTYSLSDEADLVAGAVVGAGRRRTPAGAPGSEFGAAPDLTYVEFKAYF
ncbi:MAG TPA: hypothetical protein VLD85_14910 [Anaeromyxobacteraceae bacterium]|nr:hypothetical protein [Anaeromyxobacteraceae bacterium]